MENGKGGVITTRDAIDLHEASVFGGESWSFVVRRTIVSDKGASSPRFMREVPKVVFFVLDPTFENRSVDGLLTIIAINDIRKDNFI